MLKEDIERAKEARLKAHSPYSNFQVGVLLRCKNGHTYTGCNVENHGIQSICAERVAFTKAISEGDKDFEYMVVCGAKKGEEVHEECMPCGYCRQFISEFVDNNFKIYIVTGKNAKKYKLSDILPHRFR
jgi:cytidine deaminase